MNLPPPALPTPLRYDSVTAGCLSCGQELRSPDGRHRSYCSGACRQLAWRRCRTQNPAPFAAAALPVRRASTIVYQCETCETRFVGGQRCPDCGLFARRLGVGGPCPNCEEPVAINDLIDDHAEVHQRTRRRCLPNLPLGVCEVAEFHCALQHRGEMSSDTDERTATGASLSVSCQLWQKATRH